MSSMLLRAARPEDSMRHALLTPLISSVRLEMNFSSLLVRCHFPAFQGRGLTPDIRGGLPLKMVSTSFDFDQAQFDAAREKMKACPPMEASRLDFKGAAGTASTP